jgi:enolase-phosphatase E1
VAPVYDDVPPALRAWQARGLALHVYSSGSVAAQQLLFAHTSAGDLSGLFTGWFDTGVGGKLQAESYTRIAATLGLPPAALLFLSDHPQEVAAARAAGWQALRVERGQAPGADAGPALCSFAELAL